MKDCQINISHSQLTALHHWIGFVIANCGTNTYLRLHAMTLARFHAKKIAPKISQLVPQLEYTFKVNAEQSLALQMSFFARDSRSEMGQNYYLLLEVSYQLPRFVAHHAEDLLPPASITDLELNEP